MSRLARLEERRIDPSALVIASQAHEVYRRISDSESVRYTVGAMQPIDPEYTKATFAQGDRVKSQLSQRLPQKCDFEYQGSTTTDTHIRARSDIDLLVIHNDWEWLEHPQVPQNPYRGVPADDMRKLRSDAISAVQSAFPEATVETDGSTAICVSGASLRRQVDIVPASWHNTNEYARTGEKVYRGVKVFNSDTGEFVANTPFLHKRRIEERDQRTRGGLRKAIRLMKTLMYDSEGRLDMSSYNITGIAYNIPEHELNVQRPRELAILEACFAFCQQLHADEALRLRVRVPDDHRAVFGSGPGATLPQLLALTKELHDLRMDVLRDNYKSIRRLIEGSVEYSPALAG